jgi:Kef-type K+ transport system membrane component KefB
MQFASLATLIFSIGLLWSTSYVLGRLARAFGQAPVLGELTTGLLLGATILGRVFPSTQEWLFPVTGWTASFHSGLSQLGSCALLFFAGTETGFSAIARSRKTAFWVSLGGIALPFSLGFALIRTNPALVPLEPGISEINLAVFFAAALSISALPVIAKTLMDFGMYRTRIGNITMAAAGLDDLAGWMIFGAIVMSLDGRGTSGLSALQSSGMPLVALACGVALGDSVRLTQTTRHWIRRIVLQVLAPIFLGQAFLHVDFAAHFDVSLVAWILAIACLGKIVGCGIAARFCGVKTQEAWAIGACMNSRGAMEIILCLSALKIGLIGEALFVALSVMACITSLVAAPLLKILVILPPSADLERIPILTQ